MKLSQIKGERCMEVLADLIAPVADMAMDENVASFFSKDKCPEGVEPRIFLLEKVKQGIPSMIKDHKDRLIEILCIIGDIDKDEYLKNLTMPELIKDVFELINDEVFTSLF